MLWLIDLDGVLWLAGRPIEGSADAVARLRRAGNRVLFLTNNSSVLVDETIEKMNEFGIEAGPDDLVTSAQAAASLIEPGSRALVCGGPGVEEAIRVRGAEPVRERPADAVIVGWHRDFDFERLKTAFHAVEDGARLIGTNDDPTYPTPEGLVPGGGAILAAVATATGKTPTVAGKPHRAMASLVAERVGGQVSEGVMVGDRPSTDGLMAKRLGLTFALVLSGVTGEEDLPVDPSPQAVAPDLDSLVGEGGELENE